MGAGTSRDAGTGAGAGTSTSTGSDADGGTETETEPDTTGGAGTRTAGKGAVVAERAGEAGADGGPGAAGGAAGAAIAAEDSSGADDTSGTDDAPGTDDTSGAGEPGRRFSLTRDTARPEGGGRAAPLDAPAPARQWPLLSVLGTTGLGLLIVGLHPFAEAFRIGTILIGIALIGGAVMRRVLPSVGMLAVRSRFTDMLTYGLLGVTIVLLSLMTQPKPWLEIPFLEDTLHFTVR
ncbi:DUF3017 domain-containing protein [Streptomyces sp. NPDC088124]|uniref:DUF3017 domain-containing protein n=1 Tax=Streptomyces sp. NPDC088124 TaxID=3154654 RepID=UPI00343500F4